MTSPREQATRARIRMLLVKRAELLLERIRQGAEDRVIAHEGYMIVEAATALAPDVGAFHLARRSWDILGLCGGCGLLEVGEGEVTHESGLCSTCLAAEAASIHGFGPDDGV